MTFAQIDTFSGSLGMFTPFNALIPDERNENTAVLYLLHGLSDDHSIWMRRTSIERYVDGKNIAVIMPTTHRAYYTDCPSGLKYFTYISEELPNKVKTVFGLNPQRERTFAAGLSMGGYGALKLALRCPRKYGAVLSMSGAVYERKIMSTAETISVFGEEAKPEDDLFRLAKTFEGKTSDAPKIYMNCGTDDFLLKANREFRDLLTEVGLDLTYEEFPGNHNWEYWDARIKEFIEVIK